MEPMLPAVSVESKLDGPCQPRSTLGPAGNGRARIYAAEGVDSVAVERWGTLKQHLVPRVSCDLMLSSPPTRRRRSRMLRKPKPSFCNRATSKPLPSSSTTSSTISALRQPKLTWAVLAPLCLTTFVRDSCASRKRHRAFSGESVFTSSSQIKSISRWWVCDSSRHKPRNAAANPRMSSVEE